MDYATKEQAVQAAIEQGMKPEHVKAVEHADGTWHATYSDQWWADNMTHSD